MRKYVHRVGRTARAGKLGSAWTLVERQEARAFKAMLATAGRTEHVKRVNLHAAQLDALRPAYEVCDATLLSVLIVADGAGGLACSVRSCRVSTGVQSSVSHLYCKRDAWQAVDDMQVI